MSNSKLIDNTRYLLDETSEKVVAELFKQIVPRKAKFGRVLVIGKKRRAVVEVSQFKVYYEVPSEWEFSIKGGADFEPMALDLQAASAAERAEKKVKTPKAEQKPDAPKEPRGTGFMALIDKCLRAGTFTVGATLDLVMKDFPEKNLHSVRRIISNRPNILRRRGTEEGLKWAPSGPNVGTGYVKAIDDLFFAGGSSVQEIAAKVHALFPKKDPEGVLRLTRTRPNRLRKMGKAFGFIQRRGKALYAYKFDGTKGSEEAIGAVAASPVSKEKVKKAKSAPVKKARKPRKDKGSKRASK